MRELAVVEEAHAGRYDARFLIETLEHSRFAVGYGDWMAEGDRLFVWYRGRGRGPQRPSDLKFEVFGEEWMSVMQQLRISGGLGS